MEKKINCILEGVLNKINPSQNELDYIHQFLNNFIKNLEKRFKEMKIDAEVFVGGSFAKKTLIKKGEYDVDVFVRFEEKYKDIEISKLTEKAIKGIKDIKKVLLIHGSRDYFKINVSPLFFVEIVPVIKIKKPKEARNITDLSFFHVNYMKKRLKTEKIIGDIRLAKAFCHATNCYGAESYINGFSGYSIELLVYYYKGFLNFLRAITRIKEREIIDIEKQYKNKNEIMMNMNSAKMLSPIVLIDPTFKERNAAAALSKETFKQFKEECIKFLKKPSLEAFEIKKADLEKIKKNAQKNKFEFILIKLETDKQEGDIAGSKLIKFYKHLTNEIEKYYKITNKGFEYKGKKEAESFFVVKNKNEIILTGPNANDKKNANLFKKKHRDTFIKKNRIYAREKIKQNIEEFIKNWKLKNHKNMEEMNIHRLDIQK